MKRFFRLSDIRANPRRDVSDELRFHMDMRIKEFIDAGMSTEDAKRAAAQAFGDVSAIDAELRVARGERALSRERRDRFNELRTDLAFAIRTFRKNRGFTAAALATLALGVGATTAVFTVVNGVLLRPLPYSEPSRLAMIWMASTKPGETGQLPVSSGFYSDAAAKTKLFESTAAFRSWGYTLSANGETQQYAGSRVTPSLFGVLGVRPLLGTAFTDADAAADIKIALIGYSLWQRVFGGDPAIVGKRVEMSGSTYQITGVMPPGFAFPRGAELIAGLQFGNRTEIWTPLVFDARDRVAYGNLNLAAVARLKPGIAASQAKAEWTTNLQNLLKEIAPSLQLAFEVVGLKDQAGGPVRRGLLLLMGAVAFVLFIACANVANLLVARTAARRRELAMRAALGAGRSRIARQLITENVLLAATGTAMGLLLSLWATRAMLSMVPGSMPRADDIGLDWRVGLGLVGIAVLVGAAFGAIATMQVRLGHLATSLRDAGTGAAGERSGGIGRRGLVVAEVSLSVMLVVGAGLLTASFARLQRVEPGFEKGNVLTAGVSLPLPNGFNPTRDGPAWASFFSQLQARVSRLPGVRAAGLVSVLPLTGTAEGGGFAIVGRPAPIAGQAPHTQYAIVEGDYFKAAGIKLISGRVFDSHDVTNGTQVVVVSREFARHHFADSTVLDRRIRTFFDFGAGAERTIVGVVDDVRQGSLDGAMEPMTYVPESQMSYPALRLIVRTAGDPLAVVPAIKREMKALDARIPLPEIRTLDDVFDDSLARQRFSMTILTIFAALALLLAMVGLYGVIALSVSRRRREIGVRIALGAKPADVLRLVFGEGLKMTTIGIVAGLVGAVVVARLLTAMLYGVTTTDPSVYLVATVSVLIITLAATFIPARRATRVDPTSALRGE